MRIHLLALPLLLGCGAASSAWAPARPDPEPPAALVVLEELNAACRGWYDECAILERPELDRTRAPSGEVRAFVTTRAARLRALGMPAQWSTTFARYVTAPEEDVLLVIGGHFTPDHVGPETYSAVRARVRASPSRHLSTLERVAMSLPDPAALSSLHLPALLELVRDVAPTETAAAAVRLRSTHEQALGAPEQDAYQRARLRERIAALDRLADHRR